MNPSKNLKNINSIDINAHSYQSPKVDDRGIEMGSLLLNSDFSILHDGNAT